ncbi:MAG: tyrosine recombinase XerC [Pseudomonadota bacterium]
MSRIAPPPPAIEANPATAALLTRWLSQLSAIRGASGATITAYRTDVARFLGFLAGHLGGAPPPAALSTLAIGDFRAWMAHERRRGLSARALARAVSAVRGFFAWLEEAEGLDCRAVLALRSPRVHARLPRPVAIDDAHALIATAEALPPTPWIGARDAALLTLLWGTGLRISEALSLNQSEAPLGEVLRVTGKGNKVREVAVVALARTAVERYRGLCPYRPGPEAPLFLGARGARLHPTVARKAVQSARQALGLPASATPHALRHAFATHLLAAGGDLRAVQELLGHASLRSTQIYTAVDASHLSRVYAKAHPRAQR